ncbi:purple acid phosphatase family protein [Dactylosporangium sp. CA-092794]|uniref:purple acid phosphatase family protein n=1 Tax=Dactylosporangium sp. CA-092794 TaxID=3239929 RepID=UPI003D90BEFE
MTPDQDSPIEAPPVRGQLSRRGLFAGLGGAAALAAGAGALAPATAWAGDGTPLFWHQPGAAGAPEVHGVHLQFGADSAREMVVSWTTPTSVRGAKVHLGTLSGGYGRTVEADTVHYADAKSGSEVLVHHARLTGLRPDTEYAYAAVHDGGTPLPGFFRTAPQGRARFTFTSFGDQGTPTLGKQTTPAGSTSPIWVNDNLGSPAAGDVVAGVERIAPLLHLVNGDLCYANLSDDRVRTWSDWFVNNSRSARFRPWMPAAGNHENELGNGPIGYGAYQSYFKLPDAGGDTETRGLWYAFTVGSVRFISLNNDDICYQDGGNSYVRGYSGGAQRRWLEAELSRTRGNRDIDWIVVVMHQVVISTVDNFNGADRGIREEWVPLFDKYGVDLVVCGHEHHYERSLPIRGAQPNDTLTPIPVSTDLAVSDTSQGTVHMVLGGGGTSAPSNALFFEPAQCRVITGAGPVGSNGKRPPIYVRENAPWSASRDKTHPYGFAAFTVDPGSHPGDQTRMAVTYYAVTGPFGALTPVDTFTLVRPRRDGRH